MTGFEFVGYFILFILVVGFAMPLLEKLGERYSNWLDDVFDKDTTED